MLHEGEFVPALFSQCVSAPALSQGGDIYNIRLIAKLLHATHESRNVPLTLFSGLESYLA